MSCIDLYRIFICFLLMPAGFLWLQSPPDASAEQASQYFAASYTVSSDNAQVSHAAVRLTPIQIDFTAQPFKPISITSQIQPPRDMNIRSAAVQKAMADILTTHGRVLVTGKTIMSGGTISDSTHLTYEGYFQMPFQIQQTEAMGKETPVTTSAIFRFSPHPPQPLGRWAVFKRWVSHIQSDMLSIWR